MTKRKAKKARRKVVYPLVNEMPLLTMTEEERKEALADFDNYVQRHYRYFHYRDREKLMRKRCFYQFPCGRAVREFYETFAPRVRSYNGTPIVVTQSLPFVLVDERRVALLPAHIPQE